MRVRCLDITAAYLPVDALDDYAARGRPRFNLVAGETYTVYAMFVSHGGPKYFLDPRLRHGEPCSLLEIVDSRIPRSMRHNPCYVEVDSFAVESVE
jgi:hypothetical protein